MSRDANLNLILVTSGNVGSIDVIGPMTRRRLDGFLTVCLSFFLGNPILFPFPIPGGERQLINKMTRFLILTFWLMMPLTTGFVVRPQYSSRMVITSTCLEMSQDVKNQAETTSKSKHDHPLARDIEGKLKKISPVPDVDKMSELAEMSAALYMNPAASKIAPHVVVTWEPEISQILHQLSKISNPSRPFMVGVVGIPGSGKSTSCETIKSMLEEINGIEDSVLVMPMDGYHYSMAELSRMENATDVIYRRGAPDTFHPAALARDLERIAHGGEDEIHIPGFDHAKGDPEPNQHTFHRNKHRIVICEGLYLLHDQDGWEHIQKFLDWTIFIQADLDVCMTRLKERNKSIPGYTPEEIEIRCDIVDRANAVLASKTAGKYAAQVVTSGASI